mgnify:CR=1 FL=1
MNTVARHLKTLGTDGALSGMTGEFLTGDGRGLAVGAHLAGTFGAICLQEVQGIAHPIATLVFAAHVFEPLLDLNVGCEVVHDVIPPVVLLVS